MVNGAITDGQMRMKKINNNQARATNQIKMNTYRVDISLNTQGFTIKAKNATEAKSKAMARLKRRSITKMVDHKNTWTDRMW